jgi:hypothetical protein
VLFRNRQVVGFQGADVSLDGFLNVGKRGILRFALGDTAGQAGTLGDPKAVFPAIDQNLSHTFILPDFGEEREPKQSRLDMPPSPAANRLGSTPLKGGRPSL